MLLWSRSPHFRGLLRRILSWKLLKLVLLLLLTKILQIYSCKLPTCWVKSVFSLENLPILVVLCGWEWNCGQDIARSTIFHGFISENGEKCLKIPSRSMHFQIIVVAWTKHYTNSNYKSFQFEQWKSFQFFCRNFFFLHVFLCSHFL